MFEMDTINAVPTPRLDVGDNAFAAQLLQDMVRREEKFDMCNSHH